MRCHVLSTTVVAVWFTDGRPAPGPTARRGAAARGRRPRGRGHCAAPCRVDPCVRTAVEGCVHSSTLCAHSSRGAAPVTVPCRGRVDPQPRCGAASSVDGEGEGEGEGEREGGRGEGGGGREGERERLGEPEREGGREGRSERERERERGREGERERGRVCSLVASCSRCSECPSPSL
jgi:ribonuclease E